VVMVVRDREMVGGAPGRSPRKTVERRKVVWVQLFSGGSLVLVLVLVLVPAMRILHRTVAVLLLRRNIVPARVEKAAWIMLDHEKLDVYKSSLEFFALTLRVLPRLPRGEREVGDIS
jgi:hypothetical protein